MTGEDEFFCPICGAEVSHPGNCCSKECSDELKQYRRELS